MKHKTEQTESQAPAKVPPTGKRKRKPRKELTDELAEEIVRLHGIGFSVRKSAKTTGLGRKVVRRVLEKKGLIESPPPPPRRQESASKLDPYKERIKEKMEKNLTVTRILREIKQAGYDGGRTILADYVRKNSAAPRPRKKVWRRFETAPAEEAQFDWSPYRVLLGGKERAVYAFGAVLGFCRKRHIRFYMSDNETTLLEAHTHAFADFGGVTKRGVYDRMATVVLGTIGKDRKPLWHPRFLEFAAFYGFEPYLCKPKDPDRKGYASHCTSFVGFVSIRGC
jgi:transposase